MRQRDDLYGQAHIDSYRATDGEEGFLWKRGSHILLLTTRGRRSGEERTHALIFREDGDRYVIVASKGGAPKHPAWYLNLQAEPEATVQVLGDVLRVRARDAEGEEYDRLWEQMTEVWPDYDRYQQRTDRRIPVVVLERI
jgi:deazaflavin-dependent oxidoreductase (nitroreductase family)